MKNLKTFEEFVNESKEAELNEFLRKDALKVDKFLSDLKKKVRDSRLIDDIKTSISMIIIDPYTTYEDLMKELIGRYKKNQEVVALAQQHINEFEGSLGPSTQLGSDLFLATQTAANGIAF